jgi:zinc transport system substrate-binding protein
MKPARASFEATALPRAFRLALLALALCLALAGTRHACAAELPRVLAGTTLIEDIVADLGQGRVSVRTLIPGSACPGHADLRASDVSFAGSARAVLIHDWQRDMPMLQALRRSAPETFARVRPVNAPGNWMLPARQAQATTALAAMLAEIAAAGAKDVQRRARERQARIAALAARVKARAAQGGIVGLRVICDAMQKPFLEWLGCVVVADYGRFEGMNPRQLAEVMSKAKAGKAVLVVDNMQSTGGSGKALADDLRAGHAVLTNFPGGDPRADTWERAVEMNLNRLLAAVKARG